MKKLIGVRFRGTGKAYSFDPGDLEITKGDLVIVETVRGVECGEVVIGPQEAEDETVIHPLKSVVRIATDEDKRHMEDLQSREKDAFRICREKIEKHRLEMKLVDVEFAFEGNKILFFFSADGRIDFRDLVKDLASVFRTRIELRQIGVRDESRMIGGIGICGRRFCCAQFLNDFQPVSIKMAKEQGLSLNPTKISGSCGRLMCCLKYEQEAYEELLRVTPNTGALVETPDGNGIVASSNLLSGLVHVRLANAAADAPPSPYRREELLVLRDAKTADKRSGQKKKRKPLEK